MQELDEKVLPVHTYFYIYIFTFVHTYVCDFKDVRAKIF